MTGHLTAGAAGLPLRTDVLVIGLGATGTGVALDAATRGLDVVGVEAQDLAFGTSRWSSKLVHGGLRYLAKLQFDVAHESAVERGILMETTAPHLVRSLPMLIPLTPGTSHAQATLTTLGLGAGDLLRIGARTVRQAVPRPRRIGVRRTLEMAPSVRREGLRGGLLGWEGRLEDDARLVTTIARTAAHHGARLHTRCRVLDVDHGRVVVRDEILGKTQHIEARVVINATGVWAGSLVPEVRLRPSRGSHLVLTGDALPGLRVAVMAPVPGESNRYVFALPQPEGTVYVGLTDEAVDDLPDVPTAPESDVEFLLRTINGALEVPLTRAHVAGTYAGLRPLLAGNGKSADLSRKHAIVVTDDRTVSVVGGKLTTYRRMAQDALDQAIAGAGLDAGPCRTRSLPLLGAAPRAQLAALPIQAALPDRLVRRYGTEATTVIESAEELTGLSRQELLDPLSEEVPVTLAELVFAVTHEAARTSDDLLDRRTRLGLVPAHRAASAALAARALELTSSVRVTRGRHGGSRPRPPRLDDPS